MTLPKIVTLCVLVFATDACGRTGSSDSRSALAGVTVAHLQAQSKASLSGVIEHPGAARRVSDSAAYIEERNGQDAWIAPRSREADYPREGVSLGQGWDSIREVKTQGACLNFNAKQAGGQAAHVETQRIYDTDSLRQAVSVSYSVEAKADFGVGGGGGSVKTTFVHSSELDHQYLNLLVKGSVQYGVDFASPAGTPHGVIELTDSARALANSDLDAFVEQCGDSFVTAIQRGAELYALYQFASAKAADKSEQSTTISVSGSYLAFSGSASTSQSSTRETVNTNQISGLKYMHIGHRGLRLPIDENSIKDSLASLGSAPELTDAQPYRVSLVRYDSLPNWPTGPLMSGPATRETLVSAYLRLGDLVATLKDANRDPDNYVLTYAPDIKARATAERLLVTAIKSLSDLLSACEAQKAGAPNINARLPVLQRCTTRSGDAIFTDYPYRALMPLAVEQKKNYFTAGTASQLDTQIQSLTAIYNSTLANIPLGHFTCPQAPQLPPCPSIAAQIAQKQNEKAAYLANYDFGNVAESRYRYWIDGIERSREDSYQVNGTLTPSELAMYRREIYCQYGVSPDAAPCPKQSLADLMQDGPITTDVLTQDITIGGDQKGTPLDAWSSLQDKIAGNAADAVKGVPHYYDLVDPVYTATGSTQFSVKGRLSITFYRSASKEAAALLVSP